MSLLTAADPQIARLADAIAQRVGQQRFSVWFENSTRLEFKHDRLEISVPNDFMGEWITNRYARVISDAASEVLGEAPQLKINVMPQLFEKSEAARPGSPPPQARPQISPATPSATPAPSRTAPAAAPPGPRLRHSLDTFVVGPGSQLAYNAAVYVSEFPGGQYNPLFVHGACGLGKTHLLQGLCKRFTVQHPAKKFAYMTGEDFTNEFLTALRGGKVDVFRRRMRELDLLVIDDVHFLRGKTATQEEFLHTFNAIEAMGRQVVMASDNHPKMIEEFGESLINRFVSGMVVRIDPPNYATRCEILRAMARRSNLKLSDAVVDWIAKRVTQNVRELEGAITRVAAHATVANRLPDVLMVQEALGDLDRQLAQPVRPESILASVCDYFALEHRDLMSGKRQRTVSLARSVAMYLIRKTSRLSFPEIAGKMGKRNHSTVISACRRIEKALARNERLTWTGHTGDRAEEAGELIQRLEEHCRSMAQVA